MLTDPMFYLVAVPAVVLLGFAKGGFAGVGVVAVPLMTLALPPVQAAAVTLPILMVQDVFAVWAFRRTWDRGILALMLPAAAVGIALGWALAAYVSGEAVELAIGVVSILFGAQRLWVERKGAPAAPAKSSPLLGVVCGVAAGFTSQVSHAGGPPFQIYVLPKRLARDVFIGTSAIFFFAVNWMKVPAYAALGQFTPQTLSASAVLLPLAVVSTWAGVWFVRRVSGEKFYTAIYVLLILVGLKLAFDGATGL